jgi:hypothetical protein
MLCHSVILSEAKNLIATCLRRHEILRFAQDDVSRPEAGGPKSMSGPEARAPIKP